MNDNTSSSDKTVLTHTVYEILCLENGKRYIGCTSNPNKRREQHLGGIHNKNHQNPLIAEDSERYDVTKFSFTAIEKCTEGESLQREKYWILRFRSHVPTLGYNIVVDACDVKLHAGELLPPRVINPARKRETKKVVKKKKQDDIYPPDAVTAELIRVADSCYAAYQRHLNVGGTMTFVQFYDQYKGYAQRQIVLDSGENVHDMVPREQDLYEYR